METASNAVDAGVLQYTDSFLVGTGGFVESNGQRLNIENVQPIVGDKELGKVPVVKRGDRVAAPLGPRHGARPTTSRSGARAW